MKYETIKEFSLQGFCPGEDAGSLSRRGCLQPGTTEATMKHSQHFFQVESRAAVSCDYCARPIERIAKTEETVEQAQDL